MSTEAELRLECVKIAASVSSPSMADRAGGIVGIAEILYSYVIGEASQDKLDDAEVVEPQKRRGRPPRS